MKILVVSENFTNGGLETQIDTTFQSLKNKVDFYFAFRNYDTKWFFENVYTDFYFSSTSTVKEFCEDVDKLVKIIEENHIDIVHAHPFFSLFPAVFAAKICNIPVVYTYHGLSSFNFPCQLNDTLLLNMLLDYEINKIFSVHLEGKEIIENIILEKSKVVFLPNSIDTNKFCKSTVSNNKSWALISRLDIDKIEAIQKLFYILNDIDIKELHVFGEGSEKETLQALVLKNNLQNKIFFEGNSDNLPEELNGKFNGIIGIGRVIMESISMGFPTILIGFNRISGIINNNIYNFIKTKNFTNKNLFDISKNELRNQITSVYNNTYDKEFYEIFRKDFSSETISKNYYNELQNTSNISLLILQDIYEEIKNTDNEDLFYSSFIIYNILMKYFSFYIRQPHQKNLFIMGNYLLKQDLFNNTIKNETKKQEGQISDILENTMTINNLKRKIKYKFKK